LNPSQPPSGLEGLEETPEETRAQRRIFSARLAELSFDRLPFIAGARGARERLGHSCVGVGRQIDSISTLFSWLGSSVFGTPKGVGPWPFFWMVRVEFGLVIVEGCFSRKACSSHFFVYTLTPFIRYRGLCPGMRFLSFLDYHVQSPNALPNSAT
jgi:hypothetical protein